MKHILEPRKRVSLLILALLLALPACGVENLFYQIGDKEVVYPEDLIPDNIVQGRSSPPLLLGDDGMPLLPEVKITDPSGTALDVDVSWDGDLFSFAVAGEESYANLRVEVVRGVNLQGYITQIPQIPFDEAQGKYKPLTIVMGQEGGAGSAQATGLEVIDARFTAVALIVGTCLAKAGVGLAALDPADLVKQIKETNAALDDDQSQAQRVLTMVERVVAAPGLTAGGPLPFLDPSAGLGALSADFLGAYDIDLDDDGEADTDPAAFDAALDGACEGAVIEVCVSQTEVNLVMEANFNDDLIDGNCLPIAHGWISADPGDTVYFTGAIHEDSAIQDPALNELLHGDTTATMVPNLIEMKDDGTQGDKVAGDNIFTITFRMPIGVKLRYKYTYGAAGENWGGTEEWPGNSRILEVKDVNGDNVVVRHDFFGDETTNKDSANGLFPSKGGTGSVTWTTDYDDDNVLNCWENRVDTDGDCALDDHRGPGGVLPITEPCQ